MDPLSITASAIGITQFAISSIVQLRDMINDLAEAKEVVRDIASNLEGVQRPLAALEELTISDPTIYTTTKADLEKTGVVEAVNKCGQACADFADNLKRWTKHSTATATKISLRDRFSVGVWNKEKIRTFRMQVQSCQATVQLQLQVPSCRQPLYIIIRIYANGLERIIQFRSAQTSEIDREQLKTRLQALETQIQDYIDLTKKQQDEAHRRRQDLQEEPEDEEDGGAQRALVTQEAEKQERLLEADQVSSVVVFSQVRSKRTGQDISNIMTSDDSKALVGMPESVVRKSANGSKT